MPGWWRVVAAVTTALFVMTLFFAKDVFVTINVTTVVAVQYHYSSRSKVFILLHRSTFFSCVVG